MLTPPILWAGARRMVGVDRAQERASAYYDEVYASSAEYVKHYTQSRYYFLWAVVADRLLVKGCESVLDLGCGPGQFASLLRDKGVRRYCGVDFSEQAIGMARSVCPDFTFVVADLFDTDVYQSVEHDVVVCTEVLEHVEGDLELLRRVRPGSWILASVPSFDDPAHVRSFTDSAEVRVRYGCLFESLRVDPFLADRAGGTLYLIEGRTRNGVLR